MDIKCVEERNHPKTVADFEDGRKDNFKHVPHAAIGKLFQILISVV